MKRSPIKASAKQMKRGTFKPRATAMAHGTSMLEKSTLARATKPMREPSTVPKAKRSRGMKGRPPTAAERRFMDAAGALPCIACAKDGRHNPLISLHHIDGRTKPGAHLLVLPLCGPHHQQDDSDLLARPSVHGRKATFTARYGTEMELLAEIRTLLARDEDSPSSVSVAP